MRCNHFITKQHNDIYEVTPMTPKDKDQTKEPGAWYCKKDELWIRSDCVCPLCKASPHSEQSILIKEFLVYLEALHAVNNHIDRNKVSELLSDIISKWKTKL